MLLLEQADRELILHPSPWPASGSDGLPGCLSQPVVVRREPLAVEDDSCAGCGWGRYAGRLSHGTTDSERTASTRCESTRLATDAASRLRGRRSH